MMDGQILNISPLIVWAIALSQLLTFGMTVWGLMSSGSRANSRRIDDHAVRLQGHAERIAQLEQAGLALPTREDLHKLTLAISDVRGEIREMRASQSGFAEHTRRQETVLNRVEQFLLERKQ
ncbi:DUF2730 family protein [Paenirhodobacter enshiensis]|uniref:DUF2730 family protein n=1 Tax=Paenirhodobacter enshiensis TaxID=1105367 RepID=UPI0035AFACAF